jgi:hypothetical protein
MLHCYSPHSGAARRYLKPSHTHAAKLALVASWLSVLLDNENITLARVDLKKLQIRNQIKALILELRRQSVGLSKCAVRY